MFFLKQGRSQPTLADFLPPSTENLQNFRRKYKQKKKINQLKEDVSWPSCLLTKICSSLSWELHYVYSVISATPTPSLGHENQTGKCLCESKVSIVYRFLRHHRRSSFALVYSGPELHGHMTSLRPSPHSPA